MKVVSIINYKGGVGKTTITANLGTELACRGYRVLLIDADPQCSLTFSFLHDDSWDWFAERELDISENYLTFTTTAFEEMKVKCKDTQIIRYNQC